MEYVATSSGSAMKRISRFGVQGAEHDLRVEESDAFLVRVVHEVLELRVAVDHMARR